jgi:pSer/pThr/pTyr-binding forkhead associated (FHA) protein
MTTTQLQNKQRRPKLFHVQSHQYIELPSNLPVIHIGKPNDSIPPDIDVSDYPNADVVSRVHAQISVEEGRYYYIQDLGSRNGTYLNGTLLPPKTRRQLKLKDKIGLGQENKFTLVFSWNE